MRSYPILSPRVRDYITSERLIHDSIVAFVDDFALQLRQLAQRGEALKPLLLFWVDGEVRGDDGSFITDKVVMELEDTKDVEEHMRQGAKKIGAYALLFFRPDAGELRLELETPHGAETWVMEKQRRGDTYLICPPERKSSSKIFGIIQSKLN